MFMVLRKKKKREIKKNDAIKNHFAADTHNHCAGSTRKKMALMLVAVQFSGKKLGKVLIRCIMNVRLCTACLQLHKGLQVEIGTLGLCKVLTFCGMADECKQKLLYNYKEALLTVVLPCSSHPQALYSARSTHRVIQE